MKNRGTMPFFSHTRKQLRRTRKQRGGACPAVGPERGQLQIRWYDRMPAWSIDKINYQLGIEFIKPNAKDLVTAASKGFIVFYETAHNAGQIKQHIVGFLIIKDADETHPECWYINWVLISAECRGQGLGTTLTNNIIAKARALKKRCIKLNVLAGSNTQKMYAAAKFVNTGSFKMVPGPNDVEVRMDEMRINL